MEWEISQVTLKVGEKITWASYYASQNGNWVTDSSAGWGSNIWADKNWKIKVGTDYRFYGIVTRVDANYDGRARARIDLIYVEEITIPKGKQ